MFRLPKLLRRAMLLSLAVSTIAVSPSAFADPPSNRNWVKTFEDNFNGSLNTSIWKHQTGPWKDSVRVRENAFTQNGNLVLRSSKVGNQYRTGFLRTRDGANLTFSQKFGYFETRMKLDTARGQWAAFWLMPKGTIHNVDRSGRDGTEIDIVEGFAPVHNATINQAIHYDGYGPSEVSVLNPAPMNGTANQWHVYAVEWTPTKYVWYIDGRAVWSITDQNQVSQVKQYMKLTSEILLGRNWVGEMDDSKLPADTLVDYVRVWRDNGAATGGGSGGDTGGGDTGGGSTGGSDGSIPGTAHSIEAENMALARKDTVSNSNASGGTVTKVEPGHTVGYGKVNYTGATGNKTVNVSFVHNPGATFVKVFVNGALKKNWPLTGSGGLKTLSAPIYLKKGDEVQVKAGGAAHLDKVTFTDAGSTGGGGGTTTPPPSTGQTVEAENMSLTRLNTISNGNASGGKVTKIQPGHSVGFAEVTYSGTAGNQPLTVSYVNNSGSAYIKLSVNGAVKKTWPLTGTGGIKTLSTTTYLKSGDVVQLKASGAAHLDKLAFGSSGSTGGGGGGTTTPPPSSGSKSFEVEKMKLTRMNSQHKAGASGNSVARLQSGQSIGLVEHTLVGASGSKSLKLTVFDKASGDLVKLYVNGQIKKSWSMSGGGRSRVLEYTGNFNSGDKITYKVWGTSDLDKLQY